MLNNNYYKKFEEQINQQQEKQEKARLLLHACCAPCSSYVLELLNSYFDITVYFYNPNMDTAEEYNKRMEELRRFLQEAPFARNVKLVDGGYEPEEFQRIAEGREMLPERGARCYDCYRLRMQKSAAYARSHGFDYFTTTLSISPYKNAEWLNEIGRKLEQEMREQGIEKPPVFLFSDFKKKSGYARSIALSREFCLYRQDYCGCRYSREERERQRAERATLQ
jgi:hypothetical protein